MTEVNYETQNTGDTEEHEALLQNCKDRTTFLLLILILFPTEIL
jgi:hypothetical protein